jgi:hypothetical protein
MAIDFDSQACTEVTEAGVFGICDDTPPPQKAAYLDFADSEKWIAWVDNQNETKVTFVAIDNCIEILKADGKTESRCDCLLRYDTTIIFIELKNRNSQGWLGVAKGQLETTIRIFENEHLLKAFTRRYAYVANKQRPYFNAANPSLAEKFEDETGFVFRVDQTIKID